MSDTIIDQTWFPGVDYVSMIYVDRSYIGNQKWEDAFTWVGDAEYALVSEHFLCQLNVDTSIAGYEFQLGDLALRLDQYNPEADLWLVARA